MTPKFTATYKSTISGFVSTVRRDSSGWNQHIGAQYKADFNLQNYELGWKTSRLGTRSASNGAIFEEDWKDFQFFLPGPERHHYQQKTRAVAYPRSRERRSIGRPRVR